VDVEPADQPVARDASDSEEAHEEADERRIAVDEGDAVDTAVIRLVLGSFTPVGDSPVDKNFPIVQLAYLREGRSNVSPPRGLADRSLGCPVLAEDFERSLAAFLLS
jgi:hypothetical protein